MLSGVYRTMASTGSFKTAFPRVVMNEQFTITILRAELAELLSKKGIF